MRARSDEFCGASARAGATGVPVWVSETVMAIPLNSRPAGQFGRWLIVPVNVLGIIVATPPPAITVATKRQIRRTVPIRDMRSHARLEGEDGFDSRCARGIREKKLAL